MRTQGVRAQKDRHLMECDTVKTGEACGLVDD